jgi:DNA-directed RNA polymerase specialized sigma subunit
MFVSCGSLVIQFRCNDTPMSMERHVPHVGQALPDQFSQIEDANISGMDRLSQIAQNRARRREVAVEAGVLDEQLRDLVRAAFADGHTGPQIAEVARLSKPRVYQIRDGRR